MAIMITSYYIGKGINLLILSHFAVVCAIRVVKKGTITNSDLNRPCFAWHPYGKSGLFKTELVIVLYITSIIHTKYISMISSTLKAIYIYVYIY